MLTAATKKKCTRIIFGNARCSVNKRVWAVLGICVSLLCCCLMWHYARRVSAVDSQLFHTLRDNPNAVFICDSEHKIIFSNAAATRLTGYNAAELKQIGLLQLVPEDLRDQHVKAFDAAITKHLVSGEPMHVSGYRAFVPVLRKDGKIFRGLLTVGTVRTNKNRIECTASLAPWVDEDIGDLTTDFDSDQFVNPATPFTGTPDSADTAKSR